MAKKKKPAESKGAPMWMPIYADLVQLLLVFFVMLFAMSSIDVEAFAEFAQAMRRTGDASFLELPGARGLTDMVGNGITEFPTSDTPLDTLQEIIEEQENMLRRIQQYHTGLENLFASAFETYFDHEDGTLQVADLMNLIVQDGVIEFTIGNELLFAPGSAALTADARIFMAELAELLDELFMPGDMIVVSGHTDNVPHGGGGGFRDNRHLSFGRAMAVIDELTRLTGIPGSAFEPRAMSEYHPVDPFADNNTPYNRQRNRRVVIAIRATPFAGTIERFGENENNGGADGWWGFDEADDYGAFEVYDLEVYDFGAYDFGTYDFGVYDGEELANLFDLLGTLSDEELEYFLGTLTEEEFEYIMEVLAENN